jgi:hypothetical protein
MSSTKIALAVARPNAIALTAMIQAMTRNAVCLAERASLLTP